MTQRPFFQRYGMVILMITFFLVPFAIRGSRMAIRGMRNEVKDWLPAGFAETKELDEFRRLFYGEAFVVVSWDGCSGKPDDPRFRMFVDKLVPEVPPSQRGDDPTAGSPEDKSARFYDEELQRYVGKLDSRTISKRKDLIGNKIGLYTTDDFHLNWGGRNEKWMRGDRDVWYYILPNGDIYRWHGTDSPMAAIFRAAKECFVPRELSGEHIATLGPLDGPWYYQNPIRLEADLFKSCTTGPSLLYDLTKDGGVLQGETEAAMARLKGWLFGPDQNQTCLFVTLSDRGRQHLHRVLGRGIIGKPRGKLLAIAEDSGLAAPPRPSMWPPPLDRLFDPPRRAAAGPMIRLGGPPVDNVAIDEEGQVTLVRLVGLSIGVGLLISWISFRSFTVVAMLSFVGMISAQTSLAIVGWSGNLLDAILMSMPSLIYVLALSGAVHLINYYRDTVFEDGFPGKPEKALQLGFFPLFLAAFTTALGLLSLVPSDIVPIRRFGLYSAIGVMFTLVLIFTFVPAVLSLWPPKSFARQALWRKSHPHADRLHNFWQVIGRFTIRHHTAVMLAGFAVTIFAAFGLRNVETSVQLLKLFDPKSKLIQDYTWLEQNLGKLVPMELVVRVPEEQMRKREFEENEAADAAEKFQLSFLDRMEISEHIRRSVDEHFGEKRGHVVGTAMLASTFVPPLPESGGSGLQVGFRGAFSRRLAVHREDLQASDYFRIDADQSELWRVSLRLGALNDVDYGRFVVSLKAAVEPVLAAYRYREAILRAVDARRSGESARGARVLLVADRAKLMANAPAPQRPEDNNAA
ncbi:MAG TPA: MMPL family transporter, partial [Pirellulaceae bacterium]